LVNIWSSSGPLKLKLTEYIVVYRPICYLSQFLYHKFHLLFSFWFKSVKYRELRGVQYIKFSFTRSRILALKRHNWCWDCEYFARFVFHLQISDHSFTLYFSNIVIFIMKNDSRMKRVAIIILSKCIFLIISYLRQHASSFMIIFMKVLKCII
jgi:hypothetical protein